jgi:formate dehydrogenase subunit delta
MNAENLVRMANEIGAFFNSQGTPEQAVAGIADHLRRFWEPRMLSAIAAHVQAGAAGLDANVARAVRSLGR